MAAGGGKLDFTEMALDVDAKVDMSPITANVGLNHNGTANVNMNHNGTANINASVKGSKDQPVAMMLLGDKNAPVSMDMGVGATIKGSSKEPVAMMMLGNEQQPISAKITGDKDQPMAASIELANLPRFSVEDIKEIMTPKLKLSFPGHRQLCFKVFGMELFSMCYGGEAQAIAQPYEATDADDCHTVACDVDTRPFPNTRKNA